MATTVKGFRTQSGESLIDYDYLANKPEQKYTTKERDKLDSIEEGAQVNTVMSVNGQDGEVQLTASDVDAFGKTENLVLVKDVHYGDAVPTTGLVAGRVFFVKVSE